MTAPDHGRSSRNRRAAIAAQGRRLLPLAATLAIAALAAAACSSPSSAPEGSGASSPAESVSNASVYLSGVTLHVGDQAGSGAQALLTAAGLISKLPFKVTWSDFTSGPPMLQAMAPGPSTLAA